MPLRLLLVLTLLTGCGLLTACSGSAKSARDWTPSPAVEADVLRQSPTPPADARTAVVVRVVDGDTLLASIGDAAAQRVRIIGVDTPETVKPGTPVACFGEVASTYAKHLLTGVTIRVAYENGGQTDHYGRQLWDVWLADGRFLAGLLVADGLGRAYPYEPQVRYAPLLQQLQAAAQADHRGLWGAPCHGHAFSTPDHTWPPT